MSKGKVVLKFGGSVLGGERDLSKAVHEIYRHWRQGSQVLAVVSAFGGTTDELLNRAKGFEAHDHCEAAATLLLTGETTSAALLALELRRAGLPVKLLNAHQLELNTRGERNDAEPVWANIARLQSELEHSIVVVSGFGGIDHKGDPTLLGRGGSDFTALFLAERLDAKCVLIKDVDGLYDSDPAVAEGRARRFETASYGTAIRLGGPLIQEKSVRFAEQHELTIELSSLGSDSGTRIGSFQDRIAQERPDERPLRVGLIGCGTVGGGVFERLTALPNDFEVVGVANLNPNKAAAAGIPAKLLSPADQLLSKNADVIVELICGVGHAADYIRRAIKSGSHVVTANKAVIAAHGNEFEMLASAAGRLVKFSAAVGGAMPALETVTHFDSTRAGGSIAGIVNGTCNLICDQFADGIELGEAIKVAQIAGFAEADPTLDIDGTDAAQKLILLARAAFGVELTLDSIERSGIQSLDPEIVAGAAERGRAIRLVAECKFSDGKLTASVGPREVPFEHPFAKTKGADNCLHIRTDSGDEQFIYGRGAGRYATAEAVIADLFDIRRSENAFNNTSQRTFSAEAGR